ncbi:serine hydroxymethyltransferase [Gordonia sp. NPDC003429]
MIVDGVEAGGPAALSGADPEIAELIAREAVRRTSTLQLVAGKTVASDAVRVALSSVLGDAYAEGYPGARFHGGCEVVDEIEQLAIARATTLFGAEYANVAPHSGSSANQAVYAAFAQPGDPVLALKLGHGGHQTHGSRANFSGRWFGSLHYGVRESDELIDYDQVRDMALLHRPRLLIAGSATYSRLVDYAVLREIADEADCVLWVDAAHLGGLMAAGAAPSPVGYADVITLTTHKVLRGPRGGIILAAARHANALQKAVFPFLQGGPALNVIAAKAVTFAESATPGFSAHVAAVVASARELSQQLDRRGLRSVSGGTDTHLAVIDVSAFGLTGIEAQRRLGAAGIVVDKAVLPFDNQPPAVGSAVRIGTPIVTLAGAREKDMAVIADWIHDALRVPVSGDGGGAHARIRGEVAALLGG